MAQRSLVALAVLAAMAAAAPASADPPPTAPPAQTQASPDIDGAVALLKLFNTDTANPKPGGDPASPGRW